MGGLGNRGAPKRSLLPSLGLTPPRHPAMHIDARTLPNGSVLEADLCIVGAGAAGISMALEWIGSRDKVLLLEGGGLDYQAAMQGLDRRESVGLPHYPLQAARPPYFRA